MDIVDTIYKIIQNADVVYIISHKTLLDYISIGDILTIGGLVLTYFLFKKQLTETRNENINGIRAQWFLEVVVEPNLGTIKNFYDNSVSKVKDSLVSLNSFYSKKTAQDFSIILAKEKRKYKDDLKDDLGHIRSLINATKPELSKDFDAKLDELIDIIRKLLDEHLNYNDSTKDVKNKLLENQQELLAILYTAIENLQIEKPTKICKKFAKDNKLSNN